MPPSEQLTLTFNLQMIFVPVVSIYADTDLFTFKSDNKSVSFEPSLCLSLDDPPVILAVGERSFSKEHSYVHLFKKPLISINYTEYLEAFLRHGVGMTASARWMRRPKFKITVSSRLVEYTSGYYDGIFRAAALQAGALGVSAIHIQKEGE